MASNSLMRFLRASPKGAFLDVKVVPNASRAEVMDEGGDRLKVRLDAPPVDGKANERLLHYLARTVFGLPKSRVILVRGEQGREKTVELELPLDTAMHLLTTALGKMGNNRKKR
jgi:uncharacterized protein (TIGR00251 family)